MLFLSTSVLFAEVLFYDNFDTADSAVGNGWSNIGSATIAIESNAMKISSPNGTGIRHDFTTITSGELSIQFDWKVISTDWYVEFFPNNPVTHLAMDSTGNLYYDRYGTMLDPVLIKKIGLDTYVHIKMIIDYTLSKFNLWVDNEIVKKRKA